MTEIYKNEYLLSFCVFDRTFSYYGTDLLTVLNDIGLEIDNMMLNADHDLRIAGYPVARVNIDGQDVLYKSFDQKDKLSDACQDKNLEKSTIEFELKNKFCLVYSFLFERFG